jgi:hypothetical protein
MLDPKMRANCLACGIARSASVDPSSGTRILLNIIITPFYENASKGKAESSTVYLPHQITSIYGIISAGNEGGSMGTQPDHQFGHFFRQP